MCKFVFNYFVELLNSVGIKKDPKLTYAGIGEPQIIENSKTKAFGSYSSAIFYDGGNNKIEHIWFSTYDWKNIQKTKIADGLNAIGEKYDMIICYHVLEHIDNDKQAMKEMMRILKPHGKCIIQTPYKEGKIHEDEEEAAEEEEDAGPGFSLPCAARSY